MVEVKFVIGANYGDEGKGLVSAKYAYNAFKEDKGCLTILYNGGPQRGHTVEDMTGFRHVYHHLAAGSTWGSDTYFHPDFMINPMTFVPEYDDIHGKCPVFDVFVDRKCKLITPYDMMANQLKETGRGDKRHGSCGMGIYETWHRSYDVFDKSVQGCYADFSQQEDRIKIKAFLANVRRYYEARGVRFDSFPGIDFEGLEEHYINDFYEMVDYCEQVDNPVDLFDRYDTIIYEGGQGLALSMTNEDDFPHLTPSVTGARKMIMHVHNYFGIDADVDMTYVTRSYITRHGNGPMDGIDAKVALEVDATNQPNPWQGTLRFAYFDEDALYKMFKRIKQDGDNDYTKSMKYLKRNLVITHANLPYDMPTTPFYLCGQMFNNIYHFGCQFVDACYFMDE